MKDGRVEEDSTITITASATVMNDTEVEGLVDTLETVVGFPQMKHTGVEDPLVSKGTVSDFLSSISPGAGFGGVGGGM